MDAFGHFFRANAFFLRPVGNRKVEAQQLLDVLDEICNSPGLGIGILGHVATDQFIDRIGAHVANCLFKRLLRHHLAALLEDDLALVVHDIVVFQNVLAGVEVARLDLLLRLLERLVDPWMDDGLIFLETELHQHRIHAVGSENAHQIILQRQEEF